MDKVFLGLAWLLLRISLGLRPWESPRSSPASPRKNPSIPPLLLGLTQFRPVRRKCLLKVSRIIDEHRCQVDKKRHCGNFFVWYLCFFLISDDNKYHNPTLLLKLIPKIKVSPLLGFKLRFCVHGRKKMYNVTRGHLLHL